MGWPLLDVFNHCFGVILPRLWNSNPPFSPEIHHPKASTSPEPPLMIYPELRKLTIKDENETGYVVSKPEHRKRLLLHAGGHPITETYFEERIMSRAELETTSDGRAIIEAWENRNRA